MAEKSLGHGKIEAFAEHVLLRVGARLVALIVMPALLFLAHDAWQDQKMINRQVAQNSLAVAVNTTRLEEHDRRLWLLERVKAALREPEIGGK